MFCNFFGRPCSGEPRSTAFWMSLPRRVKGDADSDVARVTHRARRGTGAKQAWAGDDDASQKCAWARAEAENGRAARYSKANSSKNKEIDESGGR